jgi:hypothetical protein
MQYLLDWHTTPKHRKQQHSTTPAVPEPQIMNPATSDVYSDDHTLFALHCCLTPAEMFGTHLTCFPWLLSNTE